MDLAFQFVDDTDGLVDAFDQVGRIGADRWTWRLPVFSLAPHRPKEGESL